MGCTYRIHNTLEEFPKMLTVMLNPSKQFVTNSMTVGFQHWDNKPTYSRDWGYTNRLTNKLTNEYSFLIPSTLLTSEHYRNFFLGAHQLTVS